MRALLFFLALPLMASQSLVMTSAFQAHAVTPASGSAWNSISNMRIEGCVTGLVPTVGNSRLYDSEDGSGFFTTTTQLEFRGLGGISGPGFLIGSVPEIASITNFRWRWQRTTNGVTGTYSLEIWDEQTGRYYQNQIADATPATVFNFNSKWVGPGSLQGVIPAANAKLGCLRASNAVLPIGSTIPPRLLTTGFSNMGDWEFEGVLTDQSGLSLLIGVTAGGTSYLNPTTTFAPVISLAAVSPTTRAASSSTLAISGFTNNDDPTYTCSLQQDNGPATATFDRASCSPTYTGPVFGQYDLTTRITDMLGVSTSLGFSVGAVATDSNCAVVLPEARLNRLLGPLVRLGCNPWSWFDDRNLAAADLQLGMQTGSLPATINAWGNHWDVASTHGSIAVTYGNAIVTGTGTDFQNDFCGGGTSPAATTGIIAVWYTSLDYPTPGRAFYRILSCSSATVMNLTRTWGHSPSTQTGRPYTVIDPSASDVGIGWWGIGATPANYYSNIMAFYALYYRSGLTKYRDAARLLAHNFWYGPQYDRGKNFDQTALFGTFVLQPRSMDIAGIITWSIESGEDIWPGMQWPMEWLKFVAYDSNLSLGWNVTIGSMRESAYATAALALNATYNPDSATRAAYAGYLDAVIENLWTPLQLPSGAWAQNEARDGNFSAADGTVYVTVINGSAAITLTGTTWGTGNFSANGGQIFITSKTNVNLSGNTNAAVGDTVYYHGTYVSPTTATLDRPYVDAACPSPTGCQKAMRSSGLVGFGMQPFMQGLWGGQAGAYIYDYYTLTVPNPTKANVVKGYVTSSANWLINNAVDPAVHAIYTGVDYVDCPPNIANPGECGAGLVLNGEMQPNLTYAYALAGNAAVKTAADDYYTSMWCKPTGGWTCGTPGNGNYLVDINDQGTSGGYMLNPSDGTENKWFGYFFGVGKGAAWPVTRIGGLLPPDPRALTTSGFMPVGSAKIRLTIQAPDGTITIATCAGTAGTPQGCPWSPDGRQGNHQIKTEYLTSGDVLIGPGSYQTINVQ